MEIITPIIFLLAIVLTLTAILLLAKTFLVSSGKVKITINGDKTIEVDGGSTLLTTLGNEGIFLPSACGGGGTCVQCTCQVMSGGGSILPTEEPHFSRKQIADNFRLGCQVKVKEDMEIEVEEEFEDIDVPFAVIEDVPVFPGCESVAKSQRRACFQEQMNKHIRKNFRYPDIAQEMGIQGRVYVNFIIAKDGSITNIRMRGPDKNLENEAARIIGRLPKMTPGKQRGRAVRVPFSIPITFRLQ